MTLIEKLKKDQIESKEVGATCRVKKVREILMEADKMSGLMNMTDAHVIDVLHKKILFVKTRYLHYTGTVLDCTFNRGAMEARFNEDEIEEILDLRDEEALYWIFLNDEI